MEAPLQNVFSVDLEDWFCVNNLSGVISRDEWDVCESRVERSTLLLLDILSRYHVEATFFVLGCIAERFPGLIREVESRGHEIASHGYSHRLLTSLTPEEFSADLDRSLDVLAGCCRQPILGYRAPSFSVTRKTWWALDIMRAAGITYDSSIFPVGFHPDYGIGDFPLNAHYLPEGLFEIPMSCARVLGRDVPCSGGGYFRLFPYSATRALMRKCNQQGRPVVFYIHPWEVDPEQPRVSLPALAKFRHYNNLELSVGRLERMLTDFRFTSIRNLFPEVVAAPAIAAARVLRAG